METIISNITRSLDFFKQDFKSWPLRFCLEAYAWLGTLINSILISVTVPNIPWDICYPIWITGCIGCTWTSYTRGSSIGMFGCSAFAIIDAIGYYRYLT